MKKNENDLVVNRRAFHDYEILETFEAGLQLLGTEVKSLRAHGGNIQEGYVRVIKDEIWLVGASIAPYAFGTAHNHEERRDRKLLLHKREIAKIKEKTAEKGLSVLPLALYLSKGRVKIKIGVGRGKKLYDKRKTIKEREEKRDVDRATKHYR